jgi:hypothetical protein
VSIVHVIKGGAIAGSELDGRSVATITAYLFHAGGHENPATLRANAEKSFIGSYLMGMGFTFDDTDKKAIAGSLLEMKQVVAKDSRNAERIFPYLGGEEIVESPTHSHHRYAIDFFDRTLKEASAWPDLIEIVRQRVKPERDKEKRDANRERWWQYAEKRPGLYAAIRGLPQVLAMPRVSQYSPLVFLPSGMIYAETIVVFALNSYAALAILQSRCHELWTRFFASSLEDRLRYTPSDCFETFPFPPEWGTNSRLENCGLQYHQFRSALMAKNNQGLTATYNRFHNPEESDDQILRLRQLHSEMDNAVLDAYGWTHIRQSCQFLLDYEDEDNLGDIPSRRKKPWRYRWPDDVRDEVLARLLELNRQRALQESITGEAKSYARGFGAESRKNKNSKTPDEPPLVQGFVGQEKK